MSAPSPSILAWHFVGDTLRDGRPIPPDGTKLRHRGEIIPCKCGLHASERLIDALQYAPGETLCRVRVGGTIVPHGDDKIAASERVILWRLNATMLLWRFARKCALDVIHLWDAPAIVREYLETGREDIRNAAGDAARDAGDAARDARVAAWAARAAAWAAGDAAEAATWAGGKAAEAAAWAARGAGDAEAAAWAAAWARQDDILTAFVAAEAARLGFEMEPTP